MNGINTYQKDQLTDYSIVADHLESLPKKDKETLLEDIGEYLIFRKEVDEFLSHNFASECTENCFQGQLSACCAKDSIIIFFADVVVNVLESQKSDIETLMTALTKPNTGAKCVYLGKEGCRWRMKPIVCATFLCDRAQETIFTKNLQLRDIWEKLRVVEKKFKWPDQPVLFDKLEYRFIKAGYNSPSMYLHNSPGLLRVKQAARSDSEMWYNTR